jgi:hypothetical protein
MDPFHPRALPHGKTVNSSSSHKEKLMGPYVYGKVQRIIA